MRCTALLYVAIYLVHAVLLTPRRYISSVSFTAFGVETLLSRWRNGDTVAHNKRAFGN